MDIAACGIRNINYDTKHNYELFLRDFYELHVLVYGR